MKYKTFFSLLSTALLASAAVAGGSHDGGHHAESARIGQVGRADQVTRSVIINMTDNMRFTPENIVAQQGETIKFIVKNSGKIRHEMVLGSLKELKDHDELMKKHPEMEHADDNQVTVQAGQASEIIWQFSKTGKVDFACLQPGHYAAGMSGAVAVNRKGSKPTLALNRASINVDSNHPIKQ